MGTSSSQDLHSGLRPADQILAAHAKAAGVLPDFRGNRAERMRFRAGDLVLAAYAKAAGVENVSQRAAAALRVSEMAPGALASAGRWRELTGFSVELEEGKAPAAKGATTFSHLQPVGSMEFGFKQANGNVIGRPSPAATKPVAPAPRSAENAIKEKSRVRIVRAWSGNPKGR